MDQERSTQQQEADSPALHMLLAQDEPEEEDEIHEADEESEDRLNALSEIPVEQLFSPLYRTNAKAGW